MLYYTGAIKPEEIQANPSLSLGGFKSSTQIPNGEVHNLFPKITQSSVVNNSKIIRMIVLHNQLTVPMNNVKLFIENSELCTFKMMAIAPAYDSVCSRFFFEKVNQEQHLPYQGILQSYDQTAPLIIPQLEADKFIGIWIRRELDLTKFNALDKGQDTELSCDQTIELLQQTTDTPIEDLMKFHVEWD